MKNSTISIAVCVKAVPENPSEIVLKENESWPSNLTAHAGARINKFDEYAVESALKIRDSHPGTTVDIISCGYDDAENVVRRALGMGADNGWLICTAESDIMTPRVTAKNLADVLKKKEYDIILTGAMSEDEMNGQTGPMIAAFLNIPAITGISQITLDQNTVDIKRDTEYGTTEIMKATFPIVLSVLPGINTPRYPVLTAVLKAQKKTISLSEYAMNISDSVSNGVVTIPEKVRQGRVISGTVQEQAEELYSILDGMNAVEHHKNSSS